MNEPKTQGSGNSGQPLTPVSLSGGGRKYEAINLIYNIPMFTGTEADCWKYVHKRFGTKMAALLVDVRAA